MSLPAAAMGPESGERNPILIGPCCAAASRPSHTEARIAATRASRVAMRMHEPPGGDPNRWGAPRRPPIPHDDRLAARAEAGVPSTIVVAPAAVAVVAVLVVLVLLDLTRRAVGEAGAGAD